MNKYFLCHKNEDGTYNIADKKGNLFAMGVVYAYIDTDKEDYINTSKDGKRTLWNKNGQEMPGAKDVEQIVLYSNGRYIVKDGEGHLKNYDNGATVRKICKRTLVTLGVIGAIVVPAMGIKGCVDNKNAEDNAKIAADNKLDATYMGSVPFYGYEYIYFNTDTDTKTAEFRGVIETDKAAISLLNTQKGEAKTIGEWRAQGFELHRIAENKQR